MATESLHHLLLHLLVDDSGGDPVAPVLDALVAVTGFECAYLTRVDAARDAQWVLVSRRLSERGLVIPSGGPDAWEESLCKRVFESGETHTTQADRRWPDNPIVQAHGVRSFASLPVSDQFGALRGTLCLASRDRVELAGDHLALAQLCAQVIGYQVEREAQVARARRECKNHTQRALADTLAGLAQPEALRARLAGVVAPPPPPPVPEPTPPPG